MKIEKDTGDNLIITVTKEEFKKAFTSSEQLKNFREDLIKLCGVYHQCKEELHNDER